MGEQILIQTTKDLPGLPEGSSFEVIKTLKNHYIGMHCSMAGSYKIKVLKKYCKPYKSLAQQMKELIDEVKIKKEGQNKNN